jgi:hypothetical protein
MNIEDDMVAVSETSKKIAKLNDECRKGLGNYTLVWTEGFANLGLDTQVEIVDKMTTFNTFNEDNDPYGEHDFGSIEHEYTRTNGYYAGTSTIVRVFWKIDYYDKTLEYGSTDPSNPEVTTRVLTLMLAEEY